MMSSNDGDSSGAKWSVPGSSETLVTRAGESRFGLKAASGYVEGIRRKLKDDVKEVVGLFLHSVQGA